MAWRLRLVPEKTNIDFFKLQWVTFGASVGAVIISLLAVAVLGLNYGVDFKGGTTIRTESTQELDIGVYRDALSKLEMGDIAITEVFDPTFRADQHVAQIRIEAQEGEEAITPEAIASIEAALRAVDPDLGLRIDLLDGLGDGALAVAAGHALHLEGLCVAHGESFRGRPGVGRV